MKEPRYIQYPPETPVEGENIRKDIKSIVDLAKSGVRIDNTNTGNPDPALVKKSLEKMHGKSSTDENKRGETVR